MEAKIQTIINEITQHWDLDEQEAIDEAIRELPEGCGFGSSDRSAARYQHASEKVSRVLYLYMERHGATREEARKEFKEYAPLDPCFSTWMEVRPGYYYIGMSGWDRV